MKNLRNQVSISQHLNAETLQERGEEPTLW